MGWVRICKNNQEHLVTNEIYESVFKYQGYEIAKASENPTQNAIKTRSLSKGVTNELQKPTGRENSVRLSKKI